MGRSIYTISDFSAGMLPPQFFGRYNAEMYQRGVSSMVNFIPQPQGGAKRRPGTIYRGELELSDEYIETMVLRAVEITDDGIVENQVFVAVIEGEDGKVDLQVWQMPSKGEYDKVFSLKAEGETNLLPGEKNLLPVFSGDSALESATFSEWVIPSSEALDLLYTKLHLEGLGGFGNTVYLSSTGCDAPVWETGEHDVTHSYEVWIAPVYINGFLIYGGYWYTVYETVTVEYEYQTFPSTEPFWIDFADGTRPEITQNIANTSGEIRPIRKFLLPGSTYEIGDIGPAGGFIFYKEGETHYEAAPDDLSGGPFTLALPNNANAMAKDISLSYELTGNLAGTGKDTVTSYFVTENAYQIDTLFFINSGITSTTDTATPAADDIRNIFKVKAVSGGAWKVERMITDPASHSYPASWAKSGGGTTTMDIPKVVMFCQDRMIAAANAQNPMTIWGSNIGDYSDFSLGTALDTEGFEVVLQGAAGERIQSITEHKGYLLVATNRAEWAIDIRGGITPEKMVSGALQKRTSYGFDQTLPKEAGHDLYFVSDQGKKLMSYQYSQERQTYYTDDLSVNVRSFFPDGVYSMDVTESPDRRLWVLSKGNIVIGFNLESGAAPGAYILDLGGKVVGLASTGGSEIVAVVKRERKDSAGGKETFYAIESIDFEAADPPFTDCSKKGEVDGRVFRGLGHLEGISLIANIDGATHAARNVRDGVLDLDYSGEAGYAGLQFPSRITTLPVAPPPTRRSRMISIRARLFRSMGGSMGGAQAGQKLRYRTPPDAMGEALPLFSGWKEISVDSSWEIEGDIVAQVITSDPQPFEITVLQGIMEVN